MAALRAAAAVFLGLAVMPAVRGHRAEASDVVESAALRVQGEADAVLEVGVVPAVVSDAIDKALHDAVEAKKTAEATAQDAEVKYAEQKESTRSQEIALAAAQTEQAALQKSATQMAEATSKEVGAIAAQQKGHDSLSNAAKKAADAKADEAEAEQKQREFEVEMFKLISDKKKELLALKEDHNAKQLKAREMDELQDRARIEAEAAGEVAAAASKRVGELGTKMAEAELKALEAEKVVGTANTALEAATMVAAQAQSTLADATAEAAAKKEVYEMLLMLEEFINKFYNDVDAFMDDFKKIKRSGGSSEPADVPSTKSMLVSNNKLALVYNRLGQVSKTYAETVKPGIAEVNLNANASIKRHCKVSKGHKCGADLYAALGLEKAAFSA